MNQKNDVIPDKVNPRLPGGFNLPPFGIQQILALIIVCIALWAVGVIWLTMQGASQWVGGWQDEIRIHVYLHSAEPQKIRLLKQELENVPQVDSVRQVSAQEAAAWMQNWLSDARMNQNELAKHLPVSFEISMTDEHSEFLFSDIREVAMQFGATVNEDEVDLAQAHYWISQAGFLAGFASFILALAMALIISNTLRMALLARSEEIHLMRLMGAQEWFVRMPFILEGLVLGAGAGVAAWLLLWPVVIGTADWLFSMQVDLNSWGMLIPLILGGGLVGTVGALIATAKVSSGEIPSN